ncbi:cytochrome c oxidase subunit II [Nakamurella antarctica]|uniref:Cytochrome c oxidase subunit 2 n=1 Tax=Nakamurella antarctica TaxID=1902245 RepID=A0A3G8ZKJ1_9ACTN|nr:cytochrome c oxidase subunit II [Nakamurella antarctica]AZI57773.1 cytochrome c oxidase subunit II [Nakamurella antarctica]
MASSRAVRRFTLVGGLTAASLLLSGCSLADLPRYGFPESHSIQGERMQHFWSAMFSASLVVGVLVWGLMFWAFAVYRKKKGSPLYPKQTKENLPLELVYTAVPLVMVAVLFYFTVVTENFVLKKVENPDVTVNVTAFKWGWDFSIDGTQNPDVPGDLVHTISSSDEIAVLVVPTNKVIEYRLESKDVIHSFWVPDFIFKRDVFPSPAENQVDAGNTFQNTITVEGAMVGRCAELCGQYHSMMNFEVRALPDNLYQEYTALRNQMNPETNRGYTVAEAFTKMNCGELCSPYATATHPFNTSRTADNIASGGN